MRGGGGVRRCVDGSVGGGRGWLGWVGRGVCVAGGGRVGGSVVGVGGGGVGRSVSRSVGPSVCRI